MGVTLSGEAISRTLGNINETAKREGSALAADPSLASWHDRVTFLRLPTTPRTYLAVTATLLTARAMLGEQELDVRAIKAGKSARGYSASSVAGRLASFAKEQRIDLRATSTQPMNNQPFTFKDYLSRDISVHDKYLGQWRAFNEVVDAVDSLSSEEAGAVLALLFHLSRRIDVPTISVHVIDRGKDSLDAVCDVLADFVGANSDGGRVGQAFAAAVMDLVYTPNSVILGDTQDPDVTTPGDIQVANEDGIWLWTEVKQKVVTTGDVQGFMQKVHAAGGQRAVYFALANAGYSGNIRTKPIDSQANKMGMRVDVIDSPEGALEHYLPLAAGTYASLSERLLERTHARLVQAGCSPGVLATFTAAVSVVGEVTA